MNNLLPHEHLLVALCRISFNDDDIPGLKELTESVTSWKTFTWLANEHGVSALVYHNLEKLGLLNQIPDQFVKTLHNSLLVSLTRNTYLLDKLSGAAEILGKHEISVELLKGMALELTLYGNCGLRQMNDVDVLIDSDVCLKAWNILKKNGFESLPLKSNFYKLIPRYEGKHLPELHLEDFSLEVHHNLFPGNIEITRRILSESSSLIINRQELLLPPPHLHFLYLVRHLQYHESQGESQLRLYTDLFLLADRYRDDIMDGSLFELARLTGGIDYLAGRFLILNHFWGMEMPGFLEVLINSLDKSAITDDFYSFLSKPKGHVSVTRADTFGTTIKDIPGFHRKLIHIAGEMLPTLTFMMFRYKTRNRYFALLFYPIRWFRVLNMLLKKI